MERQLLLQARGLPHYEAAHVDAVGLEVLRIHAVVADKRVGHVDHLTGVGRVGQYLLVAGHAGVEADLAEELALSAESQPRYVVPSSSTSSAGFFL